MGGYPHPSHPNPSPRNPLGDATSTSQCRPFLPNIGHMVYLRDEDVGGGVTRGLSRSYWYNPSHPAPIRVTAEVLPYRLSVPTAYAKSEAGAGTANYTRGKLVRF